MDCGVASTNKPDRYIGWQRMGNGYSLSHIYTARAFRVRHSPMASAYAAAKTSSMQVIPQIYTRA